MRLRQLTIERFRGVGHLVWYVPDLPLCLVGPGDSGKTTVLEAIELVLLPRAFISFSEADFYNGDTTVPFEIQATVTDLPSSMLSQQRFGLELRGWTADGLVRDEPDDNDELALTLRLRVDSTFEPAWHVVNDRNQDGRNISARDRELLGAIRIGEDVDRQFTWSRGSSLSRITTDLDAIPQALINAQRSARESIRSVSLPDLEAAATEAGQAGASYGASLELPLEVGIDSRISIVGAGLLSLQQANGVGVKEIGLGSRRLLALGIQQQAVRTGALALIDEIEHGLEPHRLRHLLHKMKADSVQAILTSHSATAVAQLGADGLAVVRRNSDGKVEIRQPDVSLQGTIRSTPEAVLANRVLLCEGATEWGLAVSLIRHWDTLRAVPLSARGTAVANGGGKDWAAQRATHLRSLGYECCFLVDGDHETKPTGSDMVADGITVVRWADGMATESRVVTDLPNRALPALWAAAAELKSPEGVSQQIANDVGVSIQGARSWSDWEGQLGIEAMRNAVGRVAAAKGWFKSTDGGARLGQLVAAHLEELEDCDLGRKVKELETWAYGD
jgi:hypothetical protein